MTDAAAWEEALIADLRAAGRTIIMATHLVERALDQCDRGLALDGGRIVYDGEPRGLPVLTRPAGEGAA